MLDLKEIPLALEKLIKKSLLGRTAVAEGSGYLGNGPCICTEGPPGDAIMMPDYSG